MVKKAELIEEAQALGLEVDAKGKVAEIEEAIEVAKAGLSDSEVQEKLSEAKEAKSESKTKKTDYDTEQDTEIVEDESDDSESTAKAGKRSAKAQKEAAQKQEKEERKAKSEPEADEEEKPKHKPQPMARPKIERRGKKYRELAKLLDKNKLYSLEEAVGLAQKTSPTKFDASVELHINLGVDPRQADQNIRGTVVLPHGTGKTLRIAVYGSDDDIKAAKAAGADIAGGDDFLEQLKKGELNFDVLIATPDTMSKLGQFAKVLGPKGLMPNPKSGTVTKDVKKAVSEAKAGRLEFRIDKQSIIHCAVGKVGFETANLLVNARAVVKAIQDARPPSVKGVYMLKATLTTTMGPGIKLDLKDL